MTSEARTLIKRDMLHMQDDRGRGKQESSVFQLSAPVLCCTAGRGINPQIAFYSQIALVLKQTTTTPLTCFQEANAQHKSMHFANAHWTSHCM